MKQPDMTWRADTEGRCTDVSDRYALFVGRSAADARDDGWVMAIHPDDRQRVIANVRERCRLGVGWIERYRVQAADGKHYDVRDTGLPVSCGYVGCMTVIRVHQRARPHLGIAEVVPFRHRRTMPVTVPVPLEEPSLEVRAESAG